MSDTVVETVVKILDETLDSNLSNYLIQHVQSTHLPPIHLANLSINNEPRPVRPRMPVPEQPLWMAVLATVLYSLIFVWGVAGNVMVMVVVCYNRAMHR